ncbi:unnamed protein product [Trichogramma brassicae]|uniref:Uncharacterized protein n=1 Tax=Trichogramma brassicae TaxID=86971 RepID=A0A6H5J6F4_9HYME|nr:unnamed protein product [Trichogramma brassicae]
MYIPLLYNSFQTIEIDIRDEHGQPIPFDGGTLTIILHFKYRPMSYDQIIQYGRGGGGVGSIYAGSRYQRGHGGIGCFLAGLFRLVLPVLQTGVKFLGKEALRTGLNIANDVSSENIPFKESLQSRVRETGNSLKRRAEEKLDKMMAGSGYKLQHSPTALQLIESSAGVRKLRKLTRCKKTS